MKYYKITNEYETHNGLEYKDGIVEDILPFAKEDSCCPGGRGIYFSDEKNILRFLNYGAFIREVEIPNDAQMVKDPEGGKWRASKVFLHPRKDLREVSTWEFLIESGINIHTGYALYWATCYGYVEVVKFLIKAGANVHAQEDEALCWALCWASKYGHLEVVKFLIKAGANVHALDDEALYEASFYGHLEVVKFLIEVGAKLPD